MPMSGIWFDSMMSDITVKLAVLFLLLGQTQTQDSNCDYYQNAVSGRVYTINSPRYPLNYTPGVQCRWIVKCPSDYNCQLDCPLISLPQTQICYMDRMMVSRSGDPQLSSAEYYCGQGSLRGIISTGQQIALGLISDRNSPGGKFSCQVYARKASNPTPTLCNCGVRKVNRIVGGDPTAANEFPMMVGVIYKEVNAIKCGGVIIASEQIITAAHCVVGRRSSTLDVVVGAHDVSSGFDGSVTQGVKSYLVHPQYTDTNYDYDIAIVTTQKTMVFNEYVSPVCMPFKFLTSSFDGQKVIMLGWGTQFPGGPTSRVLQMVTVDVISQTQCQSVYPNLTLRQMCTYTPGKDACQDDSGGPVLYTDPTTGRLFHVGVISYGRLCATRGYPGINTRITSLMDWIVMNTPSTLCRI